MVAATAMKTVKPDATEGAARSVVAWSPRTRHGISGRGNIWLDPPATRGEVLAMAYATDSRVDNYIEALPRWQQAICRDVRDLVHAADPEIAETIKFRNRPYFVLQGNVCALLAAKDHVNVFLYDGAIVPDPEHIITGGHDNMTARTVAIRQGERLNAPALLAMFKQIVANNRAGGWRKLKAD
jgi:hypothetical protein